VPSHPNPPATKIAIAPCCSELGRERMMQIDEWITVLRNRFPQTQPREIHLLGSPADRPYLEKLSTAINVAWPTIQVTNHAGQSSLVESVNKLTTMDELLAIDSSLLHIARLLGIRTVSFWGPTDPRTRLRPSTTPEEIHFAHLPCSPCVHIASQPPCRGNNLCMRFAVNPDYPADRNTPWVA
jgi:ADP-heptose:LPS heptosyltransferase